jgi:hypothetical protein
MSILPPAPLYQDERVLITREEHGRLIRVRRTSVPTTEEWLSAIAGRIELIVPRLDRRKLVLLLDTRDSPLASDPRLEAGLIASTNVLMEGYRRRAALVQTAVGKLQASRISRSLGAQAGIFDDEAAAIAYLLSDQP